MTYRVVLVPGDGVGPEVVGAARRVIEATGVEVEWILRDAGQGARERVSSPLPPDTVEAVRETGVALKGPTTSGGPGGGPASANLELRRALDLTVAVRPARSLGPAWGARQGLDLAIVSMLQEDLFTGAGVAAGSGGALALRELVLDGSDLEGGGEPLLAVKFMTRLGAEGFARAGLGWARAQGRRRISVVRQSDGGAAGDILLLDAARAVAPEHPALEIDDLGLDEAVGELEHRPERVDVLLTLAPHVEPLTEIVSRLVGGVGTMARVQLGEQAAVFDTVHGSAPRRAGRDSANPTAQILAGALLLRHLGETGAADRIEAAVAHVASGQPPLTTSGVADSVVASLEGAERRVR